MNPREIHRNKRLTNFEILTVGRYFNSLNDYVNIEKSCKEYRGITNQFLYNPIPLRTNKERNAFKNIQTYKLTNDDTPSIFQWLESVDKKIKDNNKEGIVIDMEEPIDIVFKKDIKPFKVNKSCYIQDWVSEFNKVVDIDEDTNIVRNYISNLFGTQHFDIIDLSNTKIKKFSPNFEITDIRAEEILLPNTLKVLPKGLTKKLDLQRITIPSSVTRIEEDAFSGNSSLVYVQLNEGLRHISENAFYDCYSLHSINIPSTVTYIGPRAFYKCNLHTITFQEGINLKNLNYGTFCSNYHLKEITIPTTVTDIGQQCFCECYKLTKIELPNNLIYLKSLMFEGCTDLVQITLPDNIIDLKGYCFRDCHSLENIKLPSKLTRIGTSCFERDWSLKNIILPESLLRIEQRAFFDCSKLTAITIPSNVSYLGDECFKDCKILNPIIVNNNIEHLGYEVFDYETVAIHDLDPSLYRKKKSNYTLIDSLSENSF